MKYVILFVLMLLSVTAGAQLPEQYIGNANGIVIARGSLNAKQISVGTQKDSAYYYEDIYRDRVSILSWMDTLNPKILHSATYSRAYIGFTDSLLVPANFRSEGVMASFTISHKNTANWPRMTIVDHPVAQALRAELDTRTGSSGTLPEVAGVYTTIGSGPGLTFKEATLFNGTYAHTGPIERCVGINLQDIDAGSISNVAFLQMPDDTGLPPDGNWTFFDSVGYPSYYKGAIRIGNKNDFGKNVMLQVNGNTWADTAKSTYASVSFARFGSDFAPVSNYGVAMTKQFTTAVGSSLFANYLVPKWEITTSAHSGSFTSVYSNPNISAGNTQNWTSATAAVRALYGHVVITTGATGTVSTINALQSSFTASAMTTTRYNGLLIQNPTGSGTVTNNIGIAIEDHTKGATSNVGLLYGATLPTGNYAQYWTTANPNYLGTGYTSVGSLRRNQAVPVYADNAAALAGGLVAGQEYRTSTGAAMIVF